MKKLVVIWLALAVVVIFCSHEVAFSKGGSFEDPDCTNLPLAASGPYVTGTFTVARDKDCGPDCAHHTIHAVLKPVFSNESYLFSYPLEGGHLCDPDDPITNEELLGEFSFLPCTLRVGDVLGLTGTPVLTKVSVTSITCRTKCNPQCTGICDLCPEQMIKGSLKIRIVPLSQ